MKAKPLPMEWLKAFARYENNHWFRIDDRAVKLVWPALMPPTQNRHEGPIILGVNYQLSRIIYATVHGVDPGSLVVDHINGDPLDNRIENLRLLTRSENISDANSHLCPRSSVPGVHYSCGRTKPWRVNIMTNAKLTHYGYFKTQAEAEARAVSVRAQLQAGIAPADVKTSA